MRKKLLSLALALAMVMSMVMPAMAAPTPASGTPAWDAKYSAVAEGNKREGIYYDRGNASGDKITSNAHSGDYPGVYFRWDDKQKMPGVFLVEDWVFDLFVNDTFYLTAKNSNSYYKYEISRKTGVQKDGVWVYGIPKEVMAKDNKGNDKKDELKNINMVFIDGTYKSAWILLTKTWHDEEGKLIWNIRENLLLDSQLKFSSGLRLGLNEEDFCEIKITDFVTAAKGKTISITETTIPTGFKFKDACILFGEGKSISGGVSLTVKPGSKSIVHFENQKKWAEIIIKKIWKNADGEKITDKALIEELNASLKFTIGGKPAILGSNLVKEGKYRVSEIECAEGYELVSKNNFKVTVAAGETKTVHFVNKDPGPDFHGSLSFEKRVDGENIIIWLANSKWASQALDILDGLEFYLDGVNGNYKVTPNTDGRVIFPDVVPGIYILSEKIEGAAKGKFTAIDPITVEIFDNEDKELFDILSPPSTGWGFDGSGLNEDFDKKATYNSDSLLSPTSTNTFVTNAFLSGGVPQTNEWVTNYKVEAINGPTEGATYLSFCSYSASLELGGDGSETFLYTDKTAEFIAEKGQNVYNSIVLAFDYIVETWGNIDTWLAFANGRPWGENYTGQFYTDEWQVPTKYIAQIVNWNLLGDGLPYGELKAVGPNGYNTDIFDFINECVDQVLAAIEEGEYKNQGHITEIVFLADDSYLLDDVHNLKCQPQIVPIGKGGFYINNEPYKPNGSLKFTKEVEDLNIVEWLMQVKGLDAVEVQEILAGLKFVLTNKYDSSIPPYVSYPDTGGEVAFEEVIPGVYILSEEFVNIAAEALFNKMADIEITIGDEPNSFTVLGGTISGNITGADIKDNDLFTIVNGHGGMYRDAGGLNYGTNSDLLNNNGDLFYIGVVNERTGIEFASFCANAGSTNFDESINAYMVAHSLSEEVKWLQAFNYIVDNYGGKDELVYKGKPTSTRTIAQVVVWALLGAIDFNNPAWDTVNLTPEEKAAVEDTMANYDGYIGKGLVVDVLFLTSVNETGDHATYRSCQPQIVPIFGTFKVTNEPYHFSGGVKFSKVMYGGLLDYIDIFNLFGVIPEFAFNLYKIDEDDNEVFIKTYYTNTEGEVSIEVLAPGYYVFKEMFGYSEPFFFGAPGELFDEDGNDLYGTWGFVWAAHNNAELYFTMPKNGGNAIWADGYDLDNEGNPIVDNWLLCKHNIMWSAGYNYHPGCVENHNGSGWLVYHEGITGDFCGGWLEAWHVPATCEKPEKISFGCTAGCGVGTGIEIGLALGHDVDYSNPTVVFYVEGQPAPGTIVYGCTRCDHTVTVYDLDLWLELTGWEDPYQGY